ncbi:MAG: hypothetical protein ACRDGD_10500 [Candidatus Limnocylindria bacterium]
MSRRSSALLIICLLQSACTGAGVASRPAASATPTDRPSPSASETPAPTQTATQAPTPVATASPTPGPTAADGIAVLELDAFGCPGGVALAWSPTDDPRFHHYTALRSPSAEIETPWPPIAPAVDWGDAYATDPFVTSAVDASIIPSETRWNYRVMAYDVANKVLAASPVRAAALGPVDELGALSVAAETGGVTTLDWRSFGGRRDCFSSYRVLFAIGGGTPNTVLSVVSDQSGSELQTDALHPGTTYALRVQAMRTTTLGSFLVAETSVATYVVPGP